MEKQNFQEVVRGLANTLVDAAGHESHSKLSIKDAGSHSESLAMGGVTLGRTFSDYAAMCDLQGEDYTFD